MRIPKPIRRIRHRTCTDVRRNVRKWVKRGKGDSQRWTKLGRYKSLLANFFGKAGGSPKRLDE